jgi:hypothetical protein
MIWDIFAIIGIGTVVCGVCVGLVIVFENVPELDQDNELK